MLRRFGVVAALVLLAGGAASSAQGPAQSFGIWRNPQNSVHIRAHACGGKSMCGTVVWANEKAQADARRGGTQKLVGTQLFQGFVPAGPNIWRGKVFVPDINKTFSGTVTRIDDRTIVGKGCLLGKVGCKSQTWTRVE
ncbi:MAG: DUF2147 domain-containing protein [Pseudomonadota bacterium]